MQTPPRQSHRCVTQSPKNLGERAPGRRGVVGLRSSTAGVGDDQAGSDRRTHGVLAAPVTRTVRNPLTEPPLGPDDGMPTDCAASFDNPRVVSKAHLVERICALDVSRMVEACAALQAAVDC